MNYKALAATASIVLALVLVPVIWGLPGAATVVAIFAIAFFGSLFICGVLWPILKDVYSFFDEVIFPK